MPATERFFADIRGILADARKQAYASVNTVMVLAYWKIGQRIVEEELAGKGRADYGHYLIRNLAKQLGDEFGKGFSLANLKNCRQFFLTFPEFEKGYAVRSQLPWTHYRLIMRVENPQARDYYLHEAATHQWSSRQLERNLASHYYERLLVVPNPTDQPESLPDKLPTGEFIKDPYVLEFLDLPETGLYRESTLEAAIITKLQPFLLELGKGFSFVGRQFRISTETSHFYIDLVFYNYLLKCFVLIDLKTTKLKHQDIGQMDMYVRMFDDLKRGADDNPTLGIILCADKDDTVVRYSVLNDSQQLFASKYLNILPSEDELRRALEARHVLQITSNETGDMP
ncbi:PDDEXK nuclease domain-containing protein [Thiothrix subterranea]|uniref:PDDEXK nuclease domain-containing protein n=1 Tax=Thiothrix subterranea TaxID=2735563 RepID=A0AA51MTA6_9GAMM|nr:PDDEXK nuclease domain-containing protein [Thiothrix subterranea]MDQ5767071.1 PDDEXK nuclease domain-containing protein [Thiothrix subterranea]WML88067.1 PDDEXK nuclease domain-containing protein [Thiothrix subterranea]